ncbi:MAG: hypothetical protein OXH92_11550 [Bryobacterales bacterium]|nr:hypothetical protein [Bryobacterales bacterium]MDE0295050.1 hypothetical protein [Bryobacterales bacterium]MDE0434630.1 hypothetical protein [Bryobacterales bacterium]
MDDHLKELMQQLGNAINDSLGESDSIAETIGEIKKEGYDVFLVIEATIGLNRNDGDTQDAPKAEPLVVSEAPFTKQDRAFLKALKIRVDE